MTTVEELKQNIQNAGWVYSDKVLECWVCQPGKVVVAKNQENGQRIAACTVCGLREDISAYVTIYNNGGWWYTLFVDWDYEEGDMGNGIQGEKIYGKGDVGRLAAIEGAKEWAKKNNVRCYI